MSVLLKAFRNLTNQSAYRPFNPIPTIIQVRQTSSFFTRLSASDLWKGITSVSNIGRKRGRGRGVRKVIDLNRGQKLGLGRKNIQLPGLNKRLEMNAKMNRITEAGENTTYEQTVASNRGERQAVKRTKKLHSLERGWAGTSLFGRSIGLPDHLKNDLKDFDCKVLFQRTRPKMVSGVGKVRNCVTLVVVGNRKGLVGFGKAYARDSKKSANLARNAALKRLRYIQLDNNSIIHDFHSSFYHTTIVCFKMPPGFGVIGDRVIKTCCNVMGIDDLYVNVIRGAQMRFNVLKAFIYGLTKQKTYQQIADEKGLNLVELREENDYLPRIIARPSNGEVRKRQDIDPLELMDFRQYLFGGRVYDTSNLAKNKRWLESLNYARYLQIYHKHRAQQSVRVKLRRRHDKVESFLTLREKARRIEKFGKIPDPPVVDYAKLNAK